MPDPRYARLRAAGCCAILRHAASPRPVLGKRTLPGWEFHSRYKKES